MYAKRMCTCAVHMRRALYHICTHSEMTRLEHPYAFASQDGSINRCKRVVDGGGKHGRVHNNIPEMQQHIIERETTTKRVSEHFPETREPPSEPNPGSPPPSSARCGLRRRWERPCRTGRTFSFGGIRSSHATGGLQPLQPRPHAFSEVGKYQVVSH